MLTLKELKKIVKVADVEKRIPSVKSLKEHKVVVKEMINADTTISVYDHGYVLYTAGNQSTVFPLHSCDDYEYVSVTGDNKELNKEFFDNENWYIRLYLESEDSLNKNYERKQRRRTISYSDGMEEYINAFADLRMEGLKILLEHEDLQLFLERLSRLSEKQQLALRLYCLNGLSLADSAALSGATERAVSEVLHRAIQKLLSMYGLPAEDISLSYHHTQGGGKKSE